MVQVLTAVTYLDGAGEEHTLPAAACALTYRHSRFSDRPDWLVLEAELELRPGDGEAIRARMDELAAKRREKQPLEWPSGGSTFKRAGGPLRRRADRGVRPQGRGDRWSPWCRKSMRASWSTGRRHGGRCAAADGAGSGDGAAGDRRGAGAGGPAAGVLTGRGKRRLQWNLSLYPACPVRERVRWPPFWRISGSTWWTTCPPR